MGVSAYSSVNRTFFLALANSDGSSSITGVYLGQPPEVFPPVPVDSNSVQLLAVDDGSPIPRLYACGCTDVIAGQLLALQPSGAWTPLPLLLNNNYTADGGSCVVGDDGMVYTKLLNAVDSSPAWMVVDPARPEQAAFKPLAVQYPWAVGMGVF